MEIKVAALIVLYHPDAELLRRNIDACLPQVEHLYVIDNSDHDLNPAIARLCNRENIHYHAFGENRGIAVALNEGCRRSIANGFKWILTLDQDSVIPANTIASFLKVIREHSDLPVGIVSPQVNAFVGDSHEARPTTDKLSKCITSGSLTNLEAYQAIGGFKDKLFIDNVDTEYSFNLRAHGFLILRDNSIVMDHQIGNIRQITLLGRTLFHTTNHNYLRCYYMTRNSLYINRQFASNSDTRGYGSAFVLKLFLKILFYEKDKRRKFISIYQGIRDFQRNVYGKYPHIPS